MVGFPSSFSRLSVGFYRIVLTRLYTFSFFFLIGSRGRTAPELYTEAGCAHTHTHTEKHTETPDQTQTHRHTHTRLLNHIRVLSGLRVSIWVDIIVGRYQLDCIAKENHDVAIQNCGGIIGDWYDMLSWRHHRRLDVNIILAVARGHPCTKPHWFFWPCDHSLSAWLSTPHGMQRRTMGLYNVVSTYDAPKLGLFFAVDFVVATFKVLLLSVFLNIRHLFTSYSWSFDFNSLY